MVRKRIFHPAPVYAAALVMVFWGGAAAAQETYHLQQSVWYDNNLDRTAARTSDTITDTQLGTSINPSPFLTLSADGTFQYGVRWPTRTAWLTALKLDWARPMTQAYKIRLSALFDYQDFRDDYRVYRNINWTGQADWSFQTAAPPGGSSNGADVSLQARRTLYPNIRDFNADTWTLLGSFTRETPRWLLRLEAEGGLRHYLNAWEGTRRLMWSMMGHGVAGSGGGGCGGGGGSGGMMPGMAMFGPGSRYMAQVGRTGDSDTVSRAAFRANARLKITDVHFAGLAAELLARPSGGYRYSTYTTGTVSGRSEFLDDSFGYSGGTASGYWNAFWPGSWRSRLALSYERRDYLDRPVLDPVMGMPTGQYRADRIWWVGFEAERSFYPTFRKRDLTLTSQAFLRDFSRSSTDPYYAGSGVAIGASCKLAW